MLRYVVLQNFYWNVERDIEKYRRVLSDADSKYSDKDTAKELLEYAEWVLRMIKYIDEKLDIENSST
jgi:hypothetical protein